MKNAAKPVKTSTWKEYNLGELLTLINGRAYRKAEERESGTPVLRIQNLNKGDRWFYSDLELPDDKYCEKGDLLFAWSATFGPYIWWGEKVIYHYHIWKIECGPKLDKKFAYYLLQHITEKVKSAGRGISMLHMTKSGMEAWKVSVPSVSEQKRIAAILDQADALRQSRRRAITRLNDLSQSIFYEIFGDPDQNPFDFAVEDLGVICDVRDGTHDSPKYIEDGYPLLTSKNFSSGTISFEGAKNISKEDFIKINKRSKVDIGDIVMPMIGTIGTPVIIKDEQNFAIKNVALFKFKEQKITADYIHAILSSPFLERNAVKTSRGGTQKFIALGDIRSLKIPVPPEPLQVQFSQRLCALNSSKKQLEKSLESLENLFLSLQQRAFRGEL